MSNKPPIGLKSFTSKATQLLNNRRALWQLIQQAFTKAERSMKTRHLFSDIQCLIRLLKAWYQDLYQLPKNSIISIIAGLLYFVVPFDMIPDFIIQLGFIDDIAVLGFIISELREELTQFRQWEAEQALNQPNGLSLEDNTHSLPQHDKITKQ